MSTVKVVTARVGADGVLTLNVPLGEADANKGLRVTVETLESPKAMPLTDRAAWLQFLEQMGGSITDPTFERHQQGDYEERETLS